MNKSLIIYGCGGHARSVADIFLSNGGTLRAFFDPLARPNEKIFGIPCLATLPEDHHASEWIIALGSSQERCKVQKMLVEQKSNFTSVIASNSYIGHETTLGEGIFVGSGAHLGPLVKIGAHTIINTHAVLDHDVMVGDFCHVSVNAVLAGKVSIGNHVFIGAGAVIRDGIRLGDHITIGAGAVVVDDLQQAGTYIGVPARLLPST